jgi:hypothetical protein
LAEGFLCDVQANHGFGSRISVTSERPKGKSSNGKPDALSSSAVKNTTKNQQNRPKEGAWSKSDHLPAVGEPDREKASLKTATQSHASHSIFQTRLF